MSVEHTASYRRFNRGNGPVTGRPSYGYEVRCSCGWSRFTNENKRRATQLHNEHKRIVRAVSPPEEMK